MKFFKEFKEFITRGNVLDMAVGIIIGGAFTAIVTALTSQILQPLINWLIAAIVGGDGLEAAVTILKPAYVLDDAGAFVLNANGAKIIDLANSIYINWGAFITAIINFILVALILFIIIKAINGARKKAEEAKARKAAEEAAPVEEAPAEPAGPTQEELLAEIRDLLKAHNEPKATEEPKEQD